MCRAGGVRGADRTRFPPEGGAGPRRYDRSVAGDGTVVGLPRTSGALVPLRREEWEPESELHDPRLSDVDEWGRSENIRALVRRLYDPIYRQWFRAEWEGLDKIPAQGGALIVANHAGGLWPLDAVMTALAVHDEHPAGRFLRMLGANLLFSTPGLGAAARKTGSTLACREDAERLLTSGELVGVWPEGFKGIGKPFVERYKLQRFGRGGFVHAALTCGVPIIPVAIIGAEEIHPVLANAKLLARLFDLPYFPITPTFPWLGPLGLVPLPSKWYIEFGEPIHTESLGAEAADDAAIVFDLTDRVRETIQSTLYRLLVQRRSVWR